jgi:hypothetical protein
MEAYEAAGRIGDLTKTAHDIPLMSIQIVVFWRIEAAPNPEGLAAGAPDRPGGWAGSRQR